MIIAISGASGFIGSELTKRHLEKGDEVRVLSRSNRTPHDKAKLFVGDINASAESLLPFLSDVDIFYHCAGEISNENMMYLTNVEGTKNLFKIAQTAKIDTWVQLSSTGVYGSHPNIKITEDSLTFPANNYEKTKLMADEFLLDSHPCNFKMVILRPSNVYGTTMTNQSLFSLISIINRGLFFFIGSRKAIANYIHVDNVVNALMLVANAATHKKTDIYIVSDHCSLQELVALIAEKLEIKTPALKLPTVIARLIASISKIIKVIPLTHSRINALTDTSLYDSGKIKSDLGYQHVISMKQGISQLCDFWRSR